MSRKLLSPVWKPWINLQQLLHFYMKYIKFSFDSISIFLLYNSHGFNMHTSWLSSLYISSVWDKYKNNTVTCIKTIRVSNVTPCLGSLYMATLWDRVLQKCWPGALNVCSHVQITHTNVPCSVKPGTLKSLFVNTHCKTMTLTMIYLCSKQTKSNNSV